VLFSLLLLYFFFFDLSSWTSYVPKDTRFSLYSDSGRASSRSRPYCTGAFSRTEIALNLPVIGASRGYLVTFENVFKRALSSGFVAVPEHGFQADRLSLRTRVCLYSFGRTVSPRQKQTKIGRGSLSATYIKTYPCVLASISVHTRRQQYYCTRSRENTIDAQQHF